MRVPGFICDSLSWTATAAHRRSPTGSLWASQRRDVCPLASVPSVLIGELIVGRERGGLSAAAPG
jgi:hypothetical protein